MPSEPGSSAVPTSSRWRLVLLRMLLSGACPSSVARTLHRAVLADPAWRAAYDRERRVERIASGAALSPGQVDLVEQQLFAALPATASSSTASSSTASSSTASSSWRWPALAAGAFAVLAVVVVGVRPAPAPSWVARGDDEAVRVGLRARCIEGGAVVGQAEAGPRAPDGRLKCPRGALLSLSMTNLGSTMRHVFVVGISDGGELRFIAPFDEASSSLPIAAGTVDRPLDVAADTGAFAADERIVLFALFSPAPLRGAEIARTLREVTSRGVRVQAIDRLPFDAETARLELLP